MLWEVLGQARAVPGPGVPQGRVPPAARAAGGLDACRGSTETVWPSSYSSVLGHGVLLSAPP